MSGTPPLTDDLLERDDELGAVAALLDEAAAGDGRVVLFEGPAGIGKTRLLTEARRLGGEAGMRVLAARSSEFEREFPFGVVRQLLEPPLAEPAAREALLASATTTGAINRDIAQQLFVTPKTVEVHLSNTYRKLGIASRRQLPGALTAAA